jgi:hypothetical protein
MDHPSPWLKYVDAGDLDDSTMKFDGMEVDSDRSEKLGRVDGLIIDVSCGRPYYVVVRAGGWFKSKFFLLPIGHVGLDTARMKLITDVSRERVDRFPGFDRGEFEKLSAEDLNRMDEETIVICCPDEVVDLSAPSARWEIWAHYRYPSWWDARFYRPDRKHEAGVTTPDARPAAADRRG